MKYSEISTLLGKTLKEVSQTNDEIIFTLEDDTQYKMFHSQDCCESVSIDDIEGDLQDLVGSPITQAESVSNEDFEKQWENSFTEKTEYGDKKTKDGGYYPESHTWTFYKLATIKGYVTIRWFGESNGYYSESVDFCKVGDEDKW